MAGYQTAVLADIELRDETLFDVEALLKERRTAKREERMTDKAIAASRLRCVRLAEFVKEAWHVLEPNAIYVHNWHIEAICEHLEAVTRGEITRLLINVPPGSMKSLLVSVMWPAWEWAMGFTSYRYITTSFAKEATVRDNCKMRDLILSEWYQAMFPHVVLRSKGETRFTNTRTGRRESSPFASLTSKRGDRLIIDDPHSVDSVESERDRNKATRRFREGALNRLNDQKRSAIVVVMQRLHERDMSGVILEIMGKDYVHLMLPMEFEPKRRCTTIIGFKDPRTYEGELLDPVRFPPEEIAKLKTGMGSHAYAGQYQQRPAAREGGQFKRHWFKIVKVLPEAAANSNRKVRRWDLAGTVEQPGKDPAWTVGLRMSTDGVRYYVENVIRFRESSHQVRVAIRTIAGQDGKAIPIVIPQDPGQAGKDQAASIIAENAGWKIYSDLEKDPKDVRGEALAAQCEAGNVFLVEAPWNESFIDELCSFPQGYKDQYDAASGAFNYLAKKKGLPPISDDLLQKMAQGGKR